MCHATRQSCPSPKWNSNVLSVAESGEWGLFLSSFLGLGWPDGQVVIWYVETGEIIDLQIRILTAVLPSTGSAVAGQHFLKQTVSTIAVTTTKCASSYLNDAAPLLTWCWCSSLDFIRFIIANNPRTRNSLSFVGTDDTHWYHTTWLIAGLCTTTQQNYILMLMSLTSVKISSLEPSHEWACLLLLFPDEDCKVTELREPRACS